MKKLIAAMCAAMLACGCSTFKSQIVHDGDGTSFSARLKPCASCGGTPRSHNVDVSGATYIKCSKCSSGTMSFKRAKNAVDSWNERN